MFASLFCCFHHCSKHHITFYFMSCCTLNNNINHEQHNHVVIKSWTKVMNVVVVKLTRFWNTSTSNQIRNKIRVKSTHLSNSIHFLNYNTIVDVSFPCVVTFTLFSFIRTRKKKRKKLNLCAPVIFAVFVLCFFQKRLFFWFPQNFQTFAERKNESRETLLFQMDVHFH